MHLANTPCRIAGKKKPRQGRVSMNEMLQIQLGMVRIIHDNFGQNQALRIEKAKYCRHRFKNWLPSEIPYQHDALPSSIRPPAHHRTVSSYVSMF